MKLENLIKFLNEYKIEEGEAFLSIENRISHEEPGHMWSSTGWTVHYSHPNPWNFIDIDLEGKDLQELLMEIYTDITKTGINRRKRQAEKLSGSL